MALVDVSLDAEAINSTLSGSNDNVSRLSSTESNSSNKGSNNNRCKYVLAMYDAFANPKSGLINLVVEYMDGGSLSDLGIDFNRLLFYRSCLIFLLFLVNNGGCADEGVIADLATQVLKGLHFLHSKMQMHVSLY